VTLAVTASYWPLKPEKSRLVSKADNDKKITLKTIPRQSNWPKNPGLSVAKVRKNAVHMTVSLGKYGLYKQSLFE
jgi:hypothetical protein